MALKNPLLWRKPSGRSSFERYSRAGRKEVRQTSEESNLYTGGEGKHSWRKN